MSWETVIGLEVHAQLSTASKLFSGTSCKYASPPNTQASFIDAGLPGILPVLNKKAVEFAVIFGLSINAEIDNNSVFERKNYFYPDLPKGYQISQYQRPIVKNGYLNIKTNNETKKIVITRAHLEEDAGKSIHDLDNQYTGIDLNRAGNPLLEIVTSPCISSACEAILYLKKLQQLLRFLAICDGNMQEGSFRCDVNLSLRKQNSQELGTRTEIKNLNSFKFIEKAIIVEEKRHKYFLENDKKIYQETRSYNPDTNTTSVLRSKEQLEDYRYFHDPDLLPVKITTELLQNIKLPELPEQIASNLSKKLKEEDIEFLISAKEIYDFFKLVETNSKAPAQLIVNWLKGPIQAYLNESGKKLNDDIDALNIAKLLNELAKQNISHETAKKIFTKLVTTNNDFELIYSEESNKQTVNKEIIINLIKDVVENHPKQLKEYKEGKEKLLGFFVGKVLKELKGQGDAAVINKIIKQYLSDKE